MFVRKSKAFVIYGHAAAIRAAQGGDAASRRDDQTQQSAVIGRKTCVCISKNRFAQGFVDLRFNSRKMNASFESNTMIQTIVQRLQMLMGPSLSFQARDRQLLRRVSSTPAYASLEPRKLLAANLFYDADSDVVTIISDSADDHVDVSLNVDGDVLVAIDGGDSAIYDPAAVTEIRFYSNAGNDSFDNTTHVDSLFVGADGDDTFQGGSGNDRVYAGAGEDVIYGGDGNDELHGGDDNDLIDGEAGNDQLHGGNGNDVIHGGTGDDYLAGEFGDDTLYGEEDTDTLLGSNGNDQVYGGTGDDSVYGQGDDDYVYGGDGDDRVRGNNGNDYLYGGEGQDFMMSDNGDDFAYGEAGDDLIFAYDGVDRLEGGEGNDQIFGEHGTNTLLGGNGADTIVGGDGVDYIFGEADDDLIYGRDGNDELDGGLGVDRLLGGDGDDSLYGSELASADSLVGEAGNDRFLVQANDTITDQESGDAVLEFIDDTAQWSDAQIVVLHDAFRQLYEATGNNLLLKETLNDDPLQLIMMSDLGGAAGINYLTTTTSWYYQNGQPVYTYTYEREIHILDWDDTSTFYNNQFVDVLIHEFAHNWDSDTELASISEPLGSYWDSFIALSGWTSSQPTSGDYTQSADGNWWYESSAQFAENYGRTNPYEDMATLFEYYFENGVDGGGSSNLDQKVALLDALMEELKTL